MIGQGLHLLRIVRVLAKHDALFFLQDRMPFSVAVIKFIFGHKSKEPEGKRLAKAFQQLGPAFIKLGQALSVRPDIVGHQVADELRYLQDNLPPFDSDLAKQEIEKQLGKSVEELFTSFEDKPVAAASIAQVHFAVDKLGNEVAVKLLRPGIEKQFRKDIKLMRTLAKKVHRFFPHYRRLRLKEVVDQFEQMVRVEMDMRMEAAAATELAENTSMDSWFKVPEIYWEMTSRRVLTLERIHGVNILDQEGLKKTGHDPAVILERAAEVFFHQVYRDGYFHADMHPGNVFVGEDGKIIAVDFGIMGRLDKRTRIFLAEMLVGFLNRDYKKVADVHFDAGYIPADQNRDLFAQACRSIGEPLFGKSQKDISLAQLLAQLLKITEDFQMETQPHLILLQKTMLFAEGMARQLNPDVNFWELSRPLIERWMHRHMGPEARVRDMACDIKQVLESLSQLPACVTTEGIKLHPDTVRAFKAKA